MKKVFLFLLLFAFPAFASPITIYSGMQIDNATLSLGSGNTVQMNGLNAGAAQTTVNGSAGSYIYSQPFTGSSYKMVLIYFSGYTNAGTSAIVFPTSFSNTPSVGINTTAATISTISTTGMTIPIGTGLSGVMQVVGY
jgi:hypothetical protein